MQDRLTLEEATRIMQRAEPIVAKIRPYLHGLGSELQGWVLAELVSMWLGGHHVLDAEDAKDVDGTDKMRENLLSVLVLTTRALIPVNETKMAHGKESSNRR